MGGLAKIPVSWPVAGGGIATKSAPIMLAAPAHLILDNVRQERRNEWRTRRGNTLNTLDDLPALNPPVIATEAPWGGLVGLCRQTDSATAGRSYNPTSAPRWHSPGITFLPNGGGQAQTCSQVTPGIWGRTAIAPTQGVPAACASAEGGGYRLAAWWTNVAANGIQVSLTTTAGASLFSDQQFGNFPNLIRPRVVYSSVANMLVLVYGSSVGGVVSCIRYSTTTGAQVGGVTTLSTNGFVGVNMYLDALYYGGNTVTIAFRDNVGTGGLRVIEYNPTTDVGTEYTPGEDASNALSLLPDPDASGIRFVGLCTAVPAVRVVRLNAVGVIQTNQLVEAVTTANIAGVAYEAGASWMVVYTTGVAGLKTFHAVKRRAGVTSAVKALYAEVTSWQGGISLVTNAWREPGTDPMRYIIQVQDTDTTQPTFLELALEFENAAATITNKWTEPQARLIPLNAGAYGMSSPGGAISSNLIQVQRTGTDRFVTCLPRISSFNASADLLGGAAPVFYQFVIDAWAVQYMNATTYTGQNQGSGCQTQQCAYLPVGSLLQTATGQLLCSHGASAKPFLPRLTPSVGAGALTALGRYSYFTTTEFTDETGNVWASDPSEAVTVTLAGGQNTIQVVAPSTPFENTARQRTVKFWRTQAAGSVYFLVHVVTGSIANTNEITYSDTPPDTALSQAFTAELQATITPALSHVVEWNRRLWGIERDFPTRVRFSKPIQAGASPMFPAGFVIDTDDGMGGCTGIAAMDDRVVVMKGRALYVAGGDGPDNTGTGAYPVFNRISSETGNIVGGPFLSTGSEVYVTSAGGVFRMARSQEVDFVGAPIDLYLSMPLLQSPETVTGMVLSPRDNEVRVQTTNYRFVHDRVFNLWERDTGGFVGGSIVMTKMLSGMTQVFFTSTGHMWTESADSTTPTDAGAAYQGSIRSPWIRPTNVGGWIRLYRARAEGTVTASGTVGLSTLYIYFDDSEFTFETFIPISTTVVAGLLRIEARPKRQKCSSFSLRLDLPAGDATVRLEEWWTIVAAKAGSPPPYPTARWSALGGSAPGSPLFWFKADAGVTMNGSNQASIWADQTPNHFDMRSQDTFGVPLATTAWPVFTSNVLNGLPSMFFAGDPGGVGPKTRMNYLGGVGTHLPAPDGAAVQIFAVVVPRGADNAQGGVICTLRLTDDDLEVGIRWDNLGGIGPSSVPIATAQSAKSRWMQPVLALQDKPTVLGWQYFGAGASPDAKFYINGAIQVFSVAPPPPFPLTSYNGVTGFSLGYINAVVAGFFHGDMCEVIGYLGTDPGTETAVTAYLGAKWGISIP